MSQVRISGRDIDQVMLVDTAGNPTNPGGGASGGGGTQPAAAFESGTMAATTEVRPLAGAPFPTTINLLSAASTRAIKFSTTGASGPWRTAPYDVDDTSGLVLVLNGHATHVQYTGAVGDTRSIV